MVSVNFHITADGRLVGLALRSRSDFPRLDRVALTMFEQAFPLPRDLIVLAAGQPRELTLPVNFSLKNK